MVERLKADLEAKKAKLEEMRRLREERRKADQRRQEARVFNAFNLSTETSINQAVGTADDNNIACAEGSRRAVEGTIWYKGNLSIQALQRGANTIILHSWHSSIKISEYRSL